MLVNRASIFIDDNKLDHWQRVRKERIHQIRSYLCRVKRINKNTRIYGVGVEVWEPSPTGRMAKLLKMLTEQNGGQMRLAGSG